MRENVRASQIELRAKLGGGKMDDDERTNAMGLLSFAHSYWEAAVVLQNATRKAIHPDAPRDYLYYHAIELYLKSFLRLKGTTVRELERMGHRTGVLYTKAIAAGLSDDPTNAEVIGFIRTNYMPSRYILTGFFTRPHPNELWGVCSVLHDEVEPQVNRAFGITRKRKIPHLTEHGDDF